MREYIQIKNIRLPILRIIILILGLFYCYLATLPKHSDFWHLNYTANLFSLGKVSYVFEALGTPDLSFLHPPGFYYFQGLWLSLGSYLFNYDLETWAPWRWGFGSGQLPAFYLYWGMIPYLAALFGLVILAYGTLRNKWISLICFGTLTFVSVIVMGQTDIFCAISIYISLLLALKGFAHNEHKTLLFFLSMIVLGVSISIKSYGSLLFPIYLIFFIYFLKQKYTNPIKVYSRASILFFSFFLPSLIIWIPFSKWIVDVIFKGESLWLFDLMIAPVGHPPYHNISIWLLGYIIIIYDLLSSLQADSTKHINHKKFIFYIFSSIAWFFVSVYSHPQWWVILVPPMLLVLDNFKYKFNYLLSFLILALFLFYPMMWLNNIEAVLNCYVPVYPIENNLSTILVTFIILFLLLWIVELRKELNIDNKVILDDKSAITQLELIAIVALIYLILLILLLLIGGGSYQLISQEVYDQPMGELSENTTFGQTFYSPYSNLDGIKLLLATYTRFNNKEIVFHLQENSSTTIDLVTLRLNASKVKDNQWHEFKFPSIIDSKHKSYYFYLESPNSTQGNAITIWYNDNDVYKNGYATRNGSMINGDMAFRINYKYRQRLI